MCQHIAESVFAEVIQPSAFESPPSRATVNSLQVTYTSYAEQLSVESTLKAAGVTLAADYWQVLPACLFVLQAVAMLVAGCCGAARSIGRSTGRTLLNSHPCWGVEQPPRPGWTGKQQHNRPWHHDLTAAGLGTASGTTCGSATTVSPPATAPPATTQALCTTTGSTPTWTPWAPTPPSRAPEPPAPAPTASSMATLPTTRR